MFSSSVHSALLLSLAATSQSTKIDRPYCNNAMDTGVIPPLPTGSNLLQVHVLHRHGSRTQWDAGATCWDGFDTMEYDCTSHVLEAAEAPLGTDLPNGTLLYRKTYLPNRNQLLGNCAVGQLVNDGAAMCRASGVHLREAYDDLLPSSPEGHVSDFFLRSDDEPRTLASGQALFAGMYPDVQAAPLVVPWYTMDVDSDSETMVPNEKVCPALAEAYAKVDAAYVASDHYAEVNVPLAAELSVALNRTVTPSEVGDGLLDCLMSVQCATVPSEGGDPPAALTPELQDQALAEETYRLYYSCNDTAVARFGAGPLLGEVLVGMEAVVTAQSSGETYAKFVILSGHDTGPMAPFLGALQIGGAEFPRFNDLLAMELHAVNGGGYAVRLVHNGEVVTGLVPGCSPGVELCPWEDFYSTVAELVPSPVECGRTDDPTWWPIVSNERT